MVDTLKIGAAAMGGYFLGRTKKAKAAISLALWLSGRGRPRDIARDQAVRLLKTERAQDLIGQMRGPILAVGKDAALALFESQAGRLSDNLQKRTDVLDGTVEGTGRKARGAIGGATGTASRLAERRRRATQPDEDEVDEGVLGEDEYIDEDEAELAPADEADEADEEDEDEYVDEDEDEYADEYEEGEPAEEDEEGEEGEEIDEGYVDETDEAEEPEETEEPDEEEVEDEPAPARRRSRQTASSSRSSRGGSARSSRGRSRRSVSA